MPEEKVKIPRLGKAATEFNVSRETLVATLKKMNFEIEDNINTNVEYFDDMRIIRVPSARFNTAITLAQPTTAAGAGGYTASGYPINFMIVLPSAVLKVMKHRNVRVFAPEQNIEADAYRVNFRFAYDAWVLDNKVKGIYVHRASTSA